MTAFLLFLVVAGGVLGDLLKARGMRLQGAPESFQGAKLVQFAITAFRNSWFLLSLLAYATSFFGFMALLSIQDVSFAVPATALGYVSETLLARWLLRERVSGRRWAGAAFVVAGVCLIV
jgi:drug/metabolite transporter (DMT)-like permease